MQAAAKIYRAVIRHLYAGRKCVQVHLRILGADVQAASAQILHKCVPLFVSYLDGDQHCQHRGRIKMEYWFPKAFKARRDLGIVFCKRMPPGRRFFCGQLQNMRNMYTAGRRIRLSVYVHNRITPNEETVFFFVDPHSLFNQLPHNRVAQIDRFPDFRADGCAGQI